MSNASPRQQVLDFFNLGQMVHMQYNDIAGHFKDTDVVVGSVIKNLTSLDVLYVHNINTVMHVYPGKNYFAAMQHEDLEVWIEEYLQKQELEKELVRATIVTQRQSRNLSIVTMIIAGISAIALCVNAYVQFAMSSGN
jgi:hypothetical protein